MKNCLYASSILSSKRVPVKPVSYSNESEEVKCCSDIISQLFYVVIVMFIYWSQQEALSGITAPLH